MPSKENTQEQKEAEVVASKYMREGPIEMGGLLPPYNK